MNSNTFRGLLTAFLSGAMFLAVAQTQPKAPPEALGLAGEEAALKAWHDAPPPQCANKPFIFVSGDSKGTYSKIAKDIAKVQACGKFFCEKETQGGYNNALHLAHNYAELGLVQVDGLDTVGKYDQHVEALRSLVSLYPAAMHVVTLTNGIKVKKEWSLKDDVVVVRSLTNLKSMSVAVWSSAVVTATNLNELLGLQMKLITVTTTDEGLGMLRKGEVGAFIGMGGRPVGWVTALDRTFRLVPLAEAEISAMMGKYTAAGYSKDSVTYDNLGQVGVPTLASQVELVVQNYKGSRGQDLVNLRACILDNIDDIREGRGAHQSWKLVTAPEKSKWKLYEGPVVKVRQTPLVGQNSTALPASAPAPAKKKL